MAREAIGTKGDHRCANWWSGRLRTAISRAAGRRQVAVNHAESPLAWLAARGHVERAGSYEAGERRARLIMRWRRWGRASRCGGTAAPIARGPPGGVPRGSTRRSTQIAAQRRFDRGGERRRAPGLFGYIVARGLRGRGAGRRRRRRWAGRAAPGKLVLWLRARSRSPISTDRSERRQAWLACADEAGHRPSRSPISASAERPGRRGCAAARRARRRRPGTP